LQNKFTALMYACENGHMGVVKLLVDAGADQDLESDVWGDNFWKTALTLAAEKGPLEVVQLLITGRAGRPLPGKVPLHALKTRESRW
jgi:ankyrin repeat protein